MAAAPLVREQQGATAVIAPEGQPTHEGPCTRSLDGDGEPLGYCAACFQDMSDGIDIVKYGRPTDEASSQTQDPS